MLRPALTLLLLLHYLLVVCAGAASRPELPKARAFGYVHRADCQVRNAWRGGSCYDDCNGAQYECRKGHRPQTLPQLLASLKGLDLHYLPVVAAPLARVAYRAAARQPRAGLADKLPAGVQGVPDAPPRRG